MAQGDVVFFDEAWDNIHGILDLDGDTFYMGLIKASGDGGVDPTAADALPAWTGGTTNYQGSEVTPGGNYIADGTLCDNPVVSQVTGDVKWDTDDPATWVKDVGSPTNASWGILYCSSRTPEYAVAYVDLGGSFNMATGDLAVAVASAGWFTEVDA